MSANTVKQKYIYFVECTKNIVYALIKDNPIDIGDKLILRSRNAESFFKVLNIGNNQTMLVHNKEVSGRLLEIVKLSN